MSVARPVLTVVVAMVATLATAASLVVVVGDDPAAAVVGDLVGDTLDDDDGSVPPLVSPPVVDPASELVSMPPDDETAPGAPPLEPPATVDEIVPDELVSLGEIEEMGEAVPVDVPEGFVEGVSTELIDERNATTKVYENPDGSQTIALASQLMHVQDETGGWVDLDLSLSDPVDGVVRPQASPVDAELGLTTSTSGFISTENEDRRIGFGTVGQEVAGTPAERHVEYPEVWQNADLHVRPLVDGVKSDIVLASPDSPRRFEFPLELEGVIPSLDPETGWISFNDADGERVAFMRPGFMYDSNVDPDSDEPAQSMAVEYDLVESSSGWVLAVTADDAWLTAPERVYPVTIDPPTQWQSAWDEAVYGHFDDMFVDSRWGNYPYDEHLKIGTWNDGYNRRRSFVRFDTSKISGETIQYAHLYLYNVHSWSCRDRPVDIHRVTVPWDGRDPWSWPGPSNGHHISEFSYAQGRSDCPDAGVVQDVTQLAKNWASGDWPSYGLMIKADDEWDNYHWKRYAAAPHTERPLLMVNIDNRPLIRNRTPASGTTFHAANRAYGFEIANPDAANTVGGETIHYRVRYGTSTSLGASSATSWKSTNSWSTAVGGKFWASASGWNRNLYWWVQVKEPSGRITTSPRWSIKPTNSRASVTHTSPRNGAGLHDLTPTLKASVSDSEGDHVYLQFEVRKGSTVIHRSPVQGRTVRSYTVPPGYLDWNESYSWRVRRLEVLPGSGYSPGDPSVNSNYLLQNWSWVGPTAKFSTVNSAPGAPAPLEPGADARITELPTTFAAATTEDPDGDTVTYQFQVASGLDGETGRLATSGWLSPSGSSVNWTPPEGTLRDGGRYTWVVRARDSIGEVSGWSAPVVFRTDLQLGRRATFPFDTLGPAAVNLATGNLVLEVGGPQYPSVGGPVGVGLTYNSQTRDLHGLTANYYQDDDADGTLDVGDTRLVHRVDGQLNFNWKASSPDGAVMAPDHWIGNWSGSLRSSSSTTEQWVLVAQSSDHVQVELNGTTVLSGSGTTTSSTIELNASPTPISVTFTESTGNANLKLKIRRPGQSNSAATIIPADWFLPEATVLPGGWAGTGASLGIAAFTSVAAPSDDTAVVVDAAGASHLYERNDAGGWDAPDGEHAVLSRTDDGAWQLLGRDGHLHRFGVDGQLLDVTSPDVALDPSAPTYSYRPVGTAELTRLGSITDATGREATLTYGGEAGCSEPSEPELSSAPIGMLCEIDYVDFGGGTTHLFYSGGQLARLVNPGGEVADFKYDTGGRLTHVRDALTADLVASGHITQPESERHLTVIDYDTQGRVEAVTAPVPAVETSDGDRTVRRYDYGDSETRVLVDDLSTPTGFVQRARYDQQGRMTDVTDAVGQTTSHGWDDEDRVVATTDPAGLKSTKVRDAAGFVTDVWGPAPSGWFGGLTPTSEHVDDVPHETIVIDDGLTGLAATWFDNADLVEVPETRTLVANATDWGAGSPATGVSADGFSARMTGGIDFAEDGKHYIRLADGQRGRIYVDDHVVFDSWDGTVDESDVTLGAGGHEITVEYRHISGDASFELRWDPPSSGEVTVPSTALAPRLGLVYETTDPDGHRVATQYADPINQRATAVTVDPDGLSLTEQSTYEGAGAGFGRLTAVTLPSGDTTTTYDYWPAGAQASGTHPCVAARGVDQGGALKTRGGPATDRVETYVYDAQGNRAGSRVNDDTWRCSSYDDRGRPVSSTDPSGKTTTVDHTDPTRIVTTYHDSAGTTRTTTEELDLLGRPIAYTDEHGTTHRTVYDPHGRAVETHRALPGQAEQLLVTRSFDAADRITAITDHLAATARTTSFTYDSVGRLTSVERPNDVDSSVAYDPETGHLERTTHADSEETIEEWSYVHTKAGRIASRTGRATTRAFTYDGAGRLVEVSEGGELVSQDQWITRQYAYDANSNRCANGPTCDGSYAYGVDDRILTSPYASSYEYDDHGNVTGWTPSATEQLDASTNIAAGAEFGPNAGVEVIDLPVRSAGDLDLTLTSDAEPVATTDGSEIGHIDARGEDPSTTVDVDLAPVDANTYTQVDLAWGKGARLFTESEGRNFITVGQQDTTTVTPTATGDLTVEADWESYRVLEERQGHVSGGTNDGQTNTPVQYFEVSGNGQVRLDMTWEGEIVQPNLDLELRDHLGRTVATAESLSTTSESLTYDVSGIDYPESYQWSAHITSLTTGADYELDIRSPQTPELELEVIGPDGASYQAPGTAMPREVAIDVTDETVGQPFNITVTSDGPTYHQITSWYHIREHAAIRAELIDGDNQSVDVATDDDGDLRLASTVRAPGPVTLRLTNESPAADLDVPWWHAPWFATTLASGSAIGSLGTAATSSHTIKADDDGPLPVDITWEPSTLRRTTTDFGSVTTSDSVYFDAVGDGQVDVSLDWQSQYDSEGYSSSANLRDSDEYTIHATGSGYVGAQLYLGTDLGASFELELIDAAGEVVDTDSGIKRSFAVSHEANGTRLDPEFWTVRVTSNHPTDVSYDLTTYWPTQTNIDLELYRDGQLVDEADAVSAFGPETVSATNSGQEVVPYELRVVNTDKRKADYDVTVVHPDRAELEVTLTDAQGAQLGQVSGDTGQLLGRWSAPKEAEYTVTVANLDGDLDVPGYGVEWEAPINNFPFVRAVLYDPDGEQVFEREQSLETPLEIDQPVTAGDWQLELSTVRRSGHAELSGTVPAPQLDPTIVYDANDHATVIDDGITRIEETLNPSGRVIERTVSDSVTGEVAESLEVGYAGPGDNRAYELHADGTVVTYLAGPGGLLAIDTDGQTAWPLSDGHNSIVGTVEPDGTYQPGPIADEFGQVTATGEHGLDWLGTEMRHRTGDTFGLVRMGVRLYDPALGRFLGVDPIDGGSANTYDYCNADPINCLDLTGMAWATWTTYAVGGLAIAGCGAFAAGTIGLGAGVCIAAAAPVVAMTSISLHSAEQGGEMGHEVVVDGLKETVMSTSPWGVNVAGGARAAWSATGALVALTGLVHGTSPEHSESLHQSKATPQTRMRAGSGGGILRM